MQVKKLKQRDTALEESMKTIDKKLLENGSCKLRNLNKEMLHLIKL